MTCPEKEFFAGRISRMTCKNKILIVDDDESIANLLSEILGSEGFGTSICHSGLEAIKANDENEFQLIILDIMMPGMNGFEACQRIRKTSDVPVIFLSAKNEESDTVIGFSMGADDYITKPFKPRELVARVNARIRRSRMRDDAGEGGSTVFDRDGLLIDAERHFVTLHDADLKLTPKEFSILELLAKRCGQPVPIRDIFETVWSVPYNSFDSNTVMVHIRRIRKKMTEIDSSKEFIETIFGVGYKLSVTDSDNVQERETRRGEV